jgi:hypothetical protein
LLSGFTLDKEKFFMKRFLLLGLVCLAVMPCLRAQEEERFEAGAFADYFRSGATGTNMFGLGGRAGIGLWPHVMLEGELSYDFNRAFTDAFTTTSGGTVSFITSGTKTLHGLFGPRWTLQRGRVHPFVEAKIGFINYMFNNAPGYNSFQNQINSLRIDNVNATLLLGGGLEGRLIGPVGLRMDIGDEMYFNRGPQNGLKVTFGPIVRF